MNIPLFCSASNVKMEKKQVIPTFLSRGKDSGTANRCQFALAITQTLHELFLKTFPCVIFMCKCKLNSDIYFMPVYLFLF